MDSNGPYGDHEIPREPKPQFKDPTTLAIHADDILNSATDVAPALHVSTTFRYSSDPKRLIAAAGSNKDEFISDGHIYSRETAPNTTRLETVLEPILHGSVVTYASGLAAIHAAYILLNPKNISIGKGYHGSHGVLSIYQKLTGARKLSLDCDVEELGAGDLIHLETPINPTGEAYNIRAYAEKAHRQGAYLLVDSTLGPPELQDPFRSGADIVMHSGTKYIGGHSDMLCGVLATQRADWVRQLRHERTYLGSVMGNMEGWLGVRSMRTMSLRVNRASENAGQLVQYLVSRLKHEAGTSTILRDTKQKHSPLAISQVVESVHHASLQAEDMESWLLEQMPHGFGPVFAIVMKTEDLARRLPSKCALFHHATSLGGVESLIEWRAMSDATVDRRLLRVSVGIEHVADLMSDLEHAFAELAGEIKNPD